MKVFNIITNNGGNPLCKPPEIKEMRVESVSFRGQVKVIIEDKEVVVQGYDLIKAVNNAMNN